jgi:hypothetical protein
MSDSESQEELSKSVHLESIGSEPSTKSNNAKKATKVTVIPPPEPTHTRKKEAVLSEEKKFV